MFLFLRFASSSPRVLEFSITNSCLWCMIGVICCNPITDCLSCTIYAIHHILGCSFRLFIFQISKSLSIHIVYGFGLLYLGSCSGLGNLFYCIICVSLIFGVGSFEFSFFKLVFMGEPTGTDVV